MDSLDPVSSSTVSKDNKQKTTPSGSPLPLHVSTASQTLAQPTATAHLPSPAASSPCPMAYSGPPSPQNIPGPVTSTQASPVSSVSSPLSSPTSSVSSSQDTPATTSPPHALSAERSTTPNSGVPDCITTIPSSASTPPAPAAAAQSSSSASAQQKLGLLSPSSYPGAGATVSGTVLADSTGQTPTSGSSVTGGQLHIEGNPLTTRETLLPASETKLLLEAIETERLRRKTLEWYLKEIMREKEALIRAQSKSIGLSSGNSSQLTFLSDFLQLQKRKTSLHHPRRHKPHSRLWMGWTTTCSLKSADCHSSRIPSL